MKSLENVRQVAYTAVAVSLAVVTIQLPFLCKNLITLTKNANSLTEHMDNDLSALLHTLNEHAPDVLSNLKGLMQALYDAVEEEGKNGEKGTNKIDKIVDNINKVLTTLDNVLSAIGKQAPGFISEINYMVTAIKDGYVIADLDIENELVKAEKNKNNSMLVKVVDKSVKGVRELASVVENIMSTKKASVGVHVRIIPRYIHDFLIPYDKCVLRSEFDEHKKFSEGTMGDLKKQLYRYDFYCKTKSVDKMRSVKNEILSALGKDIGHDSGTYDEFKTFLEDIGKGEVAKYLKGE